MPSDIDRVQEEVLDAQVRATRRRASLRRPLPIWPGATTMTQCVARNGRPSFWAQRSIELVPSVRSRSSWRARSCVTGLIPKCDVRLGANDQVNF